MIDYIRSLFQPMITQFLFFFAIQVLRCGLLAWNFRMVSQARYASIVLSDTLCAVLSFVLIQEVSAAMGLAAMAGYVAGGPVGSVLATWASTKFYR